MTKWPINYQISLWWVLSEYPEIIMKLENVVDPPNDDGEMLIIQPSLYYSLSRMPDDLKSVNNNLNILSLNAQSLNAKFYNVQILIETLQEQNIKLHAICFQESWLDDNSISTYCNCFAQGKRCSAHVDTSMNASVIDTENKSAVWESLFVSIKGSVRNKDITLGNIYRPPKDNNNKINIDQFTSELDPILTKICEGNSDSVIVGDFNINLLKVDMCNFEHFGRISRSHARIQSIS